MPVKTTQRYHYAPIGMAKIKNSGNTPVRVLRNWIIQALLVGM